MRDFVDEHARAVVKPLDQMAGRSVFVTGVKDPNRNVLLETMAQRGNAYVMAQMYVPEIVDSGDARILLIEGGERVLPAYPEDLSVKARSQLEKLGVEVRTGALVDGIDPSGVTVAGELVPARTVLWAAGIAASPLGASLGAPLDRAGRVLVEPDLSLPGAPNVYVVGDLAALERGDRLRARGGVKSQNRHHARAGDGGADPRRRLRSR